MLQPHQAEDGLADFKTECKGKKCKTGQQKNLSGATLCKEQTNMPAEESSLQLPFLASSMGLSHYKEATLLSFSIHPANVSPKHKHATGSC